MKQPTIYSKVENLSRGDYDVFVASIKEDELPMYTVINRTTGVVEYTNENIQFIKDWLQHFVPEKVEQGNGIASAANLN